MVKYINFQKIVKYNDSEKMVKYNNFTPRDLHGIRGTFNRSGDAILPRRIPEEFAPRVEKTRVDQTKLTRHRGTCYYYRYEASCD